MRSTIAIVLAIGLAACSRSAKTEPEAGTAVNVAALSAHGSSGKGAPTDPAPRVAMNEAQADAALGNVVAIDTGAPARGVPSVKDKNSVDVLAFPAAFQGHWGLSRADCDISRPDARGLMKVRGSRLDFYASSATVRTIVQHRQDRVVVDLDFKSADRRWQRREALALEVGGTRMARTEPGAVTRYEHC